MKIKIPIFLTILALLIHLLYHQYILVEVKSEKQNNQVKIYFLNLNYILQIL